MTQQSDTARTKDGAGTGSVPQWHGIYLGRVSNTRKDDLWVRVNVPQLLGDKEISNWARPAAFNSVGAIAPPSAAYKVTNNPESASGGAPYDKDWADSKPQGWGGFQKDPGTTDSTDKATTPADWPGGRGRPTGFGDETGPGPAAGTLVLVFFLGGDLNQPAYLLTSQKASA